MTMRFNKHLSKVVCLDGKRIVSFFNWYDKRNRGEATLEFTGNPDNPKRKLKTTLKYNGESINIKSYSTECVERKHGEHTEISYLSTKGESNA